MPGTKGCSGRKQGETYMRRNNAEIAENKKAGEIRGEDKKKWDALQKKRAKEQKENEIQARREANKMTRKQREQLFSRTSLTGNEKQTTIVGYLTGAGSKTEPFVIEDDDGDDGGSNKKQRISGTMLGAHDVPPRTQSRDSQGKNLAARKAALMKAERNNDGNPKCECRLPFGDCALRNSAANKTRDGRWMFRCPRYENLERRGCGWYRFMTKAEADATEARKALERLKTTK